MTLQAMKTLFYVPRFRGHTIIHPLRAKYGRVLLYAYPKSSHGGITANNLMTSICKLAGISNIGIKVRAFMVITLLTSAVAVHLINIQNRE